MDVALIAVAGLIVVGVVLFLLLRKKELPPPAAKPEALPDRGEEAGPATARARESEKEVEPDERVEEPETGATEAPTERVEPGESEPEADGEETVEPGIVMAPVEVVVESEEPAPEPPEEPEAPTPAVEEDRESRDEEVASLREGLAPTRGGFISRLAKLFEGKKEIDTGLIEDIEEVLITADIGVKTSQKILDRLKTEMENGELPAEEDVWRSLRSQARTILSSAGAEPAEKALPEVFIVVGVNGVGKTTTIGKLASLFQKEGKKVLLVAGDTFRAAAVLQLEVWGRRVGCPVVKGKENADPGSVVFDGIKKAVEEDYDAVIADTAGRLHTKVPLMEELKKVSRTAKKALDGRPADAVLLVLDSTIGQNAIQQARMFHEALEIDGLVLTKLDGTAKGGVVLGVVDEFGIPVRYIGLGERIEDLKEFDVDVFVEALFAKPDDGTVAA